MAYDEFLAERFRNALTGVAGITEKRMMGGVCFLLDGNMIGGADRTRDGTRRFMFRVGKDRHAEAMDRPGAQVMVQGGRPMSGFVFVDETACGEAELADWVAFTLTFTRSLPPKQ